MTDDPYRSLESIKQLIGTINCGAALIDRAGTIVQANRRLCTMMGRTCSDLIGANVIELYPDAADRQKMSEALGRFDEDSEAEFFLPLANGGKLPIISSARQLSGPPPLSDHRLVTMLDMSKQKQAEHVMREHYETIVKMSDTLLQQAIELKRYSQTLENRVAQRTEELHQAHMDAIYMLAVASEAKDQDTGKHVRRIQKISYQLAQRLGLAEPNAKAIGYSAILHDVGKIHIPDDILTKPGPLDERERAHMQLHTLAGERILSSSSFFELARTIARTHHENWDGSGYPDGLAKDKIPIEARIVHLADVFDALTHERVYKQAWPRERAVEAIRQGRGSMFDPQIVDVFDHAIREGALHNGDN